MDWNMIAVVEVGSATLKLVRRRQGWFGEVEASSAKSALGRIEEVDADLILDVLRIEEGRREREGDIQLAQPILLN